MRHQARGITSVALAALLVGSAVNFPKAAPDLPGRPSPQVVESSTHFGFDLYRELLKTSGGRNIFVSPSSISMALSMAANGAAGTTRDAMLGTLALRDISLEDLNRSNAALIEVLQETDPKVRLTVANSLWARMGLAFKKPFLDLNRAFYGAEVRALDFADPASPGIINAWVSEKTSGKIPSMVDQIEPSHVMFILNAIYFKGIWTREFDKQGTREQPFVLQGGKIVNVPMMNQSGRYAHLAGEGFEAVSLPYGEGRFSMYLFLPDQGSSLESFHRSLQADSWGAWMSRFRKDEGSVALPRFKMEYETALKEPLSALGMAEAFDPGRANFTGMLDTREVFINQVKHKTFVEVNEEGTEAAAATSVEVMLTSVRRGPFRIVFDRPFFCAIRDNSTGALLFLGSIYDPR